MQVSSVQLRPHVLQHARLSFPSPTPEVFSNSCPLSQWFLPTISSPVVSFSSCLQSFPASGSFLMSWLFMSGGQRIGASASASVFPMNIQGWFPLGLTGSISLLLGHYIWNTERETTWKDSPSFHCCSVAKLCLNLWLHRLQHARLPCPSPSPWVYSNSCPLSQWCHPTISSSVGPFSSCLQSFPASGSFLMSWLFTSGAQVLELQRQHQSF